MRSRLARALIPALLATPAPAHEMWLQPSTFIAPADRPVTIAFLVGDAADVTPWAFKWEKVHSFKSYGPQGIADQQATIRATTPQAPQNAIVRLHGAGTHLLVLETYQQPHEMAAAPFNEYLAEDGLASVIEQRQRDGTTGKPGREIYSRRAKTLIQSGSTATDNILQPIGQTLEIVPERNPYASGSDTRLPVRVMYHGRVLPGALVALTALGTGSKPVQRRVSDAGGRVVFEVARRGGWMISVVWTRPIADNKLADFDTVFSSLTFGYPPGSDPRR